MCCILSSYNFPFYFFHVLVYHSFQSCLKIVGHCSEKAARLLCFLSPPCPLGGLLLCWELSVQALCLFWIFYSLLVTLLYFSLGLWLRCLIQLGLHSLTHTHTLFLPFSCLIISYTCVPLEDCSAFSQTRAAVGQGDILIIGKNVILFQWRLIICSGTTFVKIKTLHTSCLMCCFERDDEKLRVDVNAKGSRSVPLKRNLVSNHWLDLLDGSIIA